MRLTASILEQLMKRESSISSEWSGTPEIVEMAKEHRFIPLFADMGGVCGVLPDGSVVEMAWDAAAPRPVVDKRLRDIALLLGAKRYPEIRDIIPARPSGAKDCEQCAGTGTLSVNGREVSGVACKCGGLGWIPPDWEK